MRHRTHRSSAARPVRTRSLLLLVTGATLLAAAGATGATFDLDLEQLREVSPRPGTVIDSSNLPAYRHLLDRDFERFVDGGFAALTVGDPLSFTPHQAFIAATRRYGGQAQLSDQPGQLVGFVHGLPFPARLSVGDDTAGEKLAWNMRYAYTGDNGVIAEMFWQMRDWRSEKTEFEMSFEARSMRFMYRHVLDPVPNVDDNPQDAYGAMVLNAIDAGSYDGTQALVFANRDEAREVNGWVYIPQLGRTQSLASFSQEESMFGSDILPTDFLAYTNRLTDMRWRYRGATYMLLPMYRHDRIEPANRKARSYDYWHADFGGRAGCFPAVNWQLRRVHVLEGTATQDAAAVARRVLYIDAQTHVAGLWKMYREDGALWKFALTAWAHPNSHVSHNHESGAPIPTAFSTIDIGTNRCTTIQLLTVVNVDDVKAREFDTGRMQTGRGMRRH